MMKLQVCTITKMGVYHLVNESNQVYQMCIDTTPVALKVGDVVYTSKPTQCDSGFMWVEFEYYFEKASNE